MNATKMTKSQLTDPLYHRKRLAEFIRERHPRLVQARRLIDTRSEQAAETYQAAIKTGETPLTALAKADAILFEGLIFSRFDTLRCVLATEFPMVPPGQQRPLALELEPHCEDVFARYNLDDGLVARSEYNHLIVELIETLRVYFQQNNLYTRWRKHTSYK